MKKVLLTLAVLLSLGGSSSLASQPIDLEVGYFDPLPTIPGHGKSPIQPPFIWQEDHEIYFDSNHSEYSISFISNGIVVYSTAVPSSTTSVELPLWLSGEYEIQIYLNSDYYFYGDITL